MRKWIYLTLLSGLMLAAMSSLSCIFPIVGGVSQWCSYTPGAVDVNLTWIPSTKQTGQYVDIGQYSTFPPGTFMGSGVLPETQNSLSWTLNGNTVYHWRVNTLADGIWYTSQTGTFTTMDCGTGTGEAPSAGLRVVIPRIGVNAPVNVRAMGADGVMGKPNGKDDVIWYDFSNYAGMGGFPGTPGSNSLLSGHVDYHPNYTAVFWDLRLLAPGDVIDIVLLDGTTLRYVVEWSTLIDDTENFSQYAQRTGIDSLTIVTCTGTFDPSTRNYSNRLVVRATRIW